MKKILFVVDENKIGGVSTVLQDLLNHLDYSNKTIDVLILHNSGNCLKNIPHNVNIIYGTPFFDIIDENLIDLLKSKLWLKILRKLYLIFLMKTGLIKNRIIKERHKMFNEVYDIEVAFKYGFCTFFTYYGFSKKKINWIHCDCKVNDPGKKYRRLLTKILKEYDINITLSKSIDNNFNSIYNCQNSIIINNIIDENKINKVIKNIKYKPTKYIKFLSVGRLSYIKGYQVLIKALNLIKKDGLIEKIRLTLIGDGEYKEELVKLVKEYDLNKYVIFLGKKIPPYRYIKNSDCFIMSSISEAYPLVLIESFIIGVPVLCTTIASAHEMIDDNKNGIIVENSIKGLYSGILNLINNPDKILNMKKQLINYKYKNDIIMEQINKILS
ncbi:MAG: glycosyltransferase [Bacilli bacterium]